MAKWPFLWYTLFILFIIEVSMRVKSAVFFLLGLVYFSSCIVLDPRSARSMTDSQEVARLELLNSIAPKTLSPSERAQIILDKMTLEEKISLMSGYKDFYVAPIERLGLRPVRFADATMGLRRIGERSTAMPAAMALAASFDKELAYQYGHLIGEECRAKGIDMVLGPGVNIVRVPTGGRNFEYFSEDPYLAGEIATAYIKAVQSLDVIACLKHFAANNCEYERHRTDTIVSKRTLNEIYFPAFKKGIQEGGALGIMMSYNPVNGISASENKYLMSDTLRDAWGYKGLIVSDWISVYSTDLPFKAGLGMDMPGGSHSSLRAVKKALGNGLLTLDVINARVRETLTAILSAGIYDRAPVDNSFIEFGLPHDQIAEKVGKESFVLLKNENQLLPLGKNIKKVVIAGPLGESTPTAGGGSSYVKAYNPVDIYSGVKQAMPWATVEASNSISAFKTADVVIVAIGFDVWHEQEAHERPYCLPSSQISVVKKALRYNKNVVVTITSGGDIETSSWIDNVPSVIHSFYGGQAIGSALASIIVGETNPSGKLPITMAKSFNDYSTTAPDRYIKQSKMVWAIFPLINLQIPLMGSRAIRDAYKGKMIYKEGVMVGYRHFTTKKIETQFPFGHGLSYTTFKIENATLSKKSIKQNESVLVNVTVTNSGEVAGAEVVQLYVRDIESSLERPDRELKGFEKLFLQPGESKTISIPLSFESFSFFDEATNSWKIEPGDFEILVGNSSESLPIVLPLEITG